MKKFVFVVLPVVANLVIGQGALAEFPRGPAAALQFEASSFMKTTEYRKPDSLSSDMAPSGAYGPYNRPFDLGESKTWYIENQRFGLDAFMAGLAWDRKDLIDRGLHILDWGFAHENKDGSFSCPDAYHSTAFFVEAAARTVLLLQASKFSSDYSSWIEKAKTKIYLSAQWMAKPDVFSQGQKGDLPFTHRFYLNASAFGLAGLLSHDDELIKLSQKVVRDGISKQTAEGVNPEKGGWDTSYQSVGLLFAIQYYVILAGDDFRATMAPTISKGLQWVKNRVGPDGAVDQTGNTRTGPGGEIGRNKKPKTMSYGSAARAFAFWAEIDGPPSYGDVARSIFEYGSKHRY